MDIKDYLHLYLGCGCKLNHDTESIFTIREYYAEYFGEYDAVGMREVPGFFDVRLLKPILRPVSYLTEENGEDILDEICEAIGVRPDLYYQAYGEILSGLSTGQWDCLDMDYSRIAEIVRILCKHGFDLFGLIEAGLAVDKTKL